MTLKRQFIAGAVCPGCGQIDKVQRVSNGEKYWIACVACGLEKDLDDAPQDVESGGQTTSRVRFVDANSSQD